MTTSQSDIILVWHFPTELLSGTVRNQSQHPLHTAVFSYFRIFSILQSFQQKREKREVVWGLGTVGSQIPFDQAGSDPVWNPKFKLLNEQAVDWSIEWNGVLSLISISRWDRSWQQRKSYQKLQLVSRNAYCVMLKCIRAAYWDV